MGPWGTNKIFVSRKKMGRDSRLRENLIQIFRLSEVQGRLREWEKYIVIVA